MLLETNIKRSMLLMKWYLLPICRKCFCYQTLKTKEHIFVRSFVAFNETFATLTDGYPDYVVVWHEGIGRRNAPEVASAFIKCAKKCAAKKIVFWCDNCSAQNKNWVLYTAIYCTVWVRCY